MNHHELLQAFNRIRDSFGTHKDIEMRNFQSLRENEQKVLCLLVNETEQLTLENIRNAPKLDETHEDVALLREQFRLFMEKEDKDDACFNNYSTSVYKNLLYKLAPSFNMKGILERVKELPIPVSFPICLTLPDIEVLITEGEYRELSDVNKAFKVGSYDVFILRPNHDPSTYVLCRNLAEMRNCWNADPSNPVRIKFDFRRNNDVNTSSTVRNNTKSTCEEFKSCVPNENYVALKSQKVPVVYTDKAIGSLIGGIHAEQLDNHVLFVTAPPGAGKTCSAEYACSSLPWLPVEYERVELTLNHRQEAETLAKAHAENKNIQSYWCAQRIFQSLCEQIVSGAMVRAKARLECAHKPTSTVVIHFDELQMLMTHRMVRRYDTHVSEDLMDYLIHAFYIIVWSYADRSGNEKIKIVLTGTNFYAPLAVNHYEMKHESFQLSGTFPPDWLYNKVFQPYFDIFLDADADKKVIMDCLESVSASRRCAELFLLLFNRVDKESFRGVKDRAPFHLFLRYCADQAYREWSAAALQALPEMCPGCIEIVTLLVYPEAFQGKFKEQSDGEETIVFPQANVFKNILEYALHGVVSVSYWCGYYVFHKPRGVIWQFLLEQCAAQVVKQKAEKAQK